MIQDQPQLLSERSHWHVDSLKLSPDDFVVNVSSQVV